MDTRSLLIVVASVSTLLTVNTATAQPAADMVTASAQPERNRFTFGASVGRGSIAINCPICENVAPLTEAFSFSAHVGWMIMPRLAVIGEYWTVRYNNRGSDWFPDSQDHAVMQHIATVSGQLWLTSRLYIRAGLGLGRHSSDSLYTKPEIYQRDENRLRSARGGNTMMFSGNVTAPATTFGIGFEFAHTTNFAADVQFRVGHTDTNESQFAVTNTGITFGVSWY